MAEKYGVTPAKLRAHGVPTTIDDSVLDDRILYWAQIIDRYTRQWFESRTKTLRIMGSGTRLLFLPMPLVNTTGLEVLLNGDTSALPSEAYQIGVDSDFLIDRQNPRIELLVADDNIYLSAFRENTWSEFEEQVITGNFGYVESDGTTPLPIQRALIKLCILDLRAGEDLWSGGGTGVPSGSTSVVGPKKKETTDGHSIEYDTSKAETITFKDDIDSLLPDREAKAILDMYMAPLAMESTGKF
jgi:hypothetical protein